MGNDADAVKRYRAGVFGRGADTYDRIGPPLLAPLGLRLVELAGLREGDRVLDVATGRGAVLFAAAELVGDMGQVVGVDLAPEMVELTAAEISSRGLESAEARVADAETLAEFADEAFDCVTCAFAIFFFPDPAAALGEFHRLLRPGGVVAISSWAGRSDPATSGTESFGVSSACRSASRPRARGTWRARCRPSGG